MNLPAALAAARLGRLYPAVILYGGSGAERRRAAVELARTLLCEAPAEERPCNACRHCRRIAWPGAAAEPQEEPQFHADFQVLERDLKASTSVEAARQLMRGAQLSPFEARGQVFVVASAESLSGEAANALLKGLEEPHVTAPRHFLLLAPGRLDLLPTVRSRSLAVFLGPAAGVDAEVVESVARSFGAAVDAYATSGAGAHLLRAAAALAVAGERPAGGKRATGGSDPEAAAGWEDPRAGLPWAVAAAAVVRSLPAPAAAAHAARASRLALAEALLGAPAMRLRGIAAERILEGLVARHLAPGTGT
jgi:DNA polymerase III, delta subunit